MAGKILRNDHRDLPAFDLLFYGQARIRNGVLIHKSSDPAEMIHMGMRDQDGLYRPLSQILLHKLHGSGGTWYSHGSVIDDPAGFPLYQGEIGHIIAPYLIDPVHHLKQTIYMIVFCILPQAGIHCVRSLLPGFQKVIGLLAPDHMTVLRHKLQTLRCVDEASSGKLCLPLIREIQNPVKAVIFFFVKSEASFLSLVRPSGPLIRVFSMTTPLLKKCKYILPH